MIYLHKVQKQVKLNFNDYPKKSQKTWQSSPLPLPTPFPLNYVAIACRERGTVTRRERHPIHHSGENKRMRWSVCKWTKWGSSHAAHKGKKNACLVKWGWFFRFMVISTFFTNALIFLLQLIWMLIRQFRADYTSFEWYQNPWYCPECKFLSLLWFCLVCISSHGCLWLFSFNIKN